MEKSWYNAYLQNGHKEELFHYRPVSLTSIVCKIYEKVIKKQWTDYLET